jgi:hypothetical protein
VIPLAASYNWNNGSAVMTLVLPLGFFIVVMIALYFVFTRPHTVPGRRPIAGARPVAPAAPGRAASLAVATGLPTATAAGGPEPLADRATPPAVGVRTEEAIKEAAQEAAAETKAAKDKVADEFASDEAAFGGSRSHDERATDKTEDQE